MNYLRDNIYDYATDLDMVHGRTFAYRWSGATNHGKWIAWQQFGPGRFISADCVVDDFGSLVPVTARLSCGIEVEQ